MMVTRCEASAFCEISGIIFIALAGSGSIHNARDHLSLVLVVIVLLCYCVWGLLLATALIPDNYCQYYYCMGIITTKCARIQLNLIARLADAVAFCFHYGGESHFNEHLHFLISLNVC